MPERLVTYLWLCLAALAAGAVNAVAGGGTLLTFPALVAVMASSVRANTTSTVALVPGSLASAWGYRRELWACRRWAFVLAWPSLAGGLLGALLLTQLEEAYFKAVVPWLILLAALLFLAQPTLSKLRQTPADRTAPSRRTLAGVIFFQFLVAVYGGYFGAGIGILMLSSLGLMGLGDIHRMNALKTFLAVCINGISVAWFVVTDQVDWRYALVMAVAAIVGGYLGARVARRLPRNLVRWIVIAIGFGLAGYFFYQQWSDRELSIEDGRSRMEGEGTALIISRGMPVAQLRNWLWRLGGL
ncbi:MAG TPA: sulfite exporter TauE/SafE family protein, partial [Gemmataceae bacterium]|nr:sulfite exporter TauE/SafE family protein [Gemmataceae bacterium]